MQFLQRVGQEKAGQLRARVARELKTNFASQNSHQVSLAEALTEKALSVYFQKMTGDELLIMPNQ